jgi:hypothetical protein
LAKRFSGIALTGFSLTVLAAAALAVTAQFLEERTVPNEGRDLTSDGSTKGTV